MGEALAVAQDGSIGPTSRSYWVVEGRFAAGAYPGDRWNPDEPAEALVQLLDAGIDTFVNLTEDLAGAESFLNRYDAHVGAAADVHRFPIVDLSIPSRSEMVETLDFLDEALDDGRNPYVHCWGGVGRTGSVVGCWLVRHGHADADTVIDEITRLREGDLGKRNPRSPETGDQRGFVRNWKQGR